MLGDEYVESDDEPYDNEHGFIPWHCSLERNKYLLEVQRSFIKDEFNLTLIKNELTFEVYYDYEDAMHMILSRTEPTEQDVEEPLFVDLYKKAGDIYGIIHRRFVTTGIGLTYLKEKYMLKEFGICPRVMCNGQAVLPIGESTRTGEARVKVSWSYCFNCRHRSTVPSAKTFTPP